MSDRLTVIYLHQYFSTPSMSGSTRSYEMAKRLVAKGYNVHMITSSRKGGGHKGWFETNEDGIKVYWLSVPYSNSMSYFRRILAFFHFAFQASMKASSIKADILFASSTPLTIALPAIYASKVNKIPMVFEVRDLWPEVPIALGALKNSIVKKIAFSLEKWAYRNSKAVVALSPGMRDGVVRAGFDYENIAVIPNSADNDFFFNDDLRDKAADFRKSTPWLQDNPLVVYTGTFGLVNGVDFIVRVAEKMLHTAPEVRFLLVGAGRELDAVKKLAAELGVLGKNLFFKDPMSKKDVAVLVCAATMMTSLVIDKPELRANSANKFFDALAAGKPILINHGGWMADIINDNECGLVVWKMNAGEAAYLLSQKIQDQSWLSHAGGNAKKLAVSQFDRGVLVNQLDEVLLIAAGCQPGKPSTVTAQYYS